MRQSLRLIKSSVRDAEKARNDAEKIWLHTEQEKYESEKAKPEACKVLHEAEQDLKEQESAQVQKVNYEKAVWEDFSLLEN